MGVSTLWLFKKNRLEISLTALNKMAYKIRGSHGPYKFDIVLRGRRRNLLGTPRIALQTP